MADIYQERIEKMKKKIMREANLQKTIEAKRKVAKSIIDSLDNWKMITELEEWAKSEFK